MARNYVAANIIMLGLLGGGLFAAFHIRQEVFPAHQIDIINFSMSYPGASPEEVEQGIILAVEEEVRGLEAVKRMTATAFEGSASVSIELVDGVDPNRALQEVKNAIDRVSSFPEDAERATIGLEMRRSSVIQLTVAGDVDERTLYAFVSSVREELLAKPEITQIDLYGGRSPEISIEVSQESLRSLALTLGDIASLIRASALDVPAGGIRTEAGEVLLRTTERRTFASEFADIPIVSRNDGTKVRLGDIASIRDGFEDTEHERFFNGMRAIDLVVYQVGDERPLEIARAVREYVAELQDRLPEGVSVITMRDRSIDYRDRMSLLLNNGLLGLVLVLVVLGLFLSPRLAFWVAMGIPVSIIGSLLLLPAMDASINMVSLFAFIVTLGIVVDDAVIVGENVFHKVEQGTPRLQAAVDGAYEMIVPVLFAVITNIIAFVPLLLVPGTTGRFFAALPTVIIAVFVISLAECLFVLPAHLGHGKPIGEANAAGGFFGMLCAIQRRSSAGFDWFTQRLYAPVVRSLLYHRYLTAAVFIASLVLTWAWYDSGRLNFNFMSQITGDRIDCEVLLPYGSSFEEASRVAKHIEDAGMRAVDCSGGREIMIGVSRYVGRGGSNSIDVNITLVPQSDREITPAEFTAAWRNEVGEIPGLESILFESSIGPGSQRLTVELSHPETDILEAAAAELAEILSNYTGVTEIDDGFAAGKPQLDFTLRPEGQAVGLTPDYVGRQLRHAYFGAEALRQQRGRDEVRVKVRLPRAERESLYDLERLMIRAPGGTELPLAAAVNVKPGRAFTRINRVNAKRVLNVSGEVIPELANADKIRDDLKAGPLPELAAQYPGLRYAFEGRQREQSEALQELFKGLAFAILGIFCLLAMLFRSYTQGFMVLLCVPFGVAGGLIGHVLMGYELSVISVFGLIAVCGVVVNGALVLTVTMNEYIGAGIPLPVAVEEASIRRFRPIMLTSLTTFFGLAPMIFEDSIQARFLVPMAISLGYGILFSTVVVLLFIPAVHRITHDIRHLLWPSV
ncbi:MAG: efflux RND transporter permease subunit [Phycisphaerae bacterium]|nr:efflux RND transporter permease subunit [Phycisphaerae bacterium]